VKLKSLMLAMIKDHFRDFEVVFWTVLFPTGLLILFISVFGQVFSGEGIEPEVNYGLHYEEATYGITDGVFRGIFHEMENATEGDFSFTEVATREQGLQIMREGEIDLLIEFPEGFSALNEAFMTGETEEGPLVSLSLYHSSRSESLLAKDIFHSVIDETNLRIVTRGEDVPIDFQRVTLGGLDEGGFSYENFIFPGMIILSLLTVSFFNLPLGLVDYIERGVLKKINASPIRAHHYYISVLATQFVVLILAMTALYTASLFFDISGRIYQWEFIGFVLFASVTALSFGLLFSSFFKNTATLAPFSNILYFVTMFLSGLYFDIQVIPGFLRWYSRINPATYLVDGLRAILFENPIPLSSFTVPGAWFVLSLGIFILNQKQVMKSE